MKLRKWLSLPLVLLLGNVAAQASIAPVTGYADNGTGVTLTVAYPSAVSAGDTLVAFVEVDNTSGTDYTVTASDSVNGAWTRTGAECSSAYNGQSDAFYLKNSSAGTPSVTFTSSTSVGMYAVIFAFSGASTTAPIDVAASCATPTNGATVTTPSVTTSVAGDMIVAAPNFAGNGGTFTIDSAYTIAQVNGIAIAYQLTTTAGTYPGATFTPQYSGSYMFGMTLALKPPGSSASAATQVGAFAAGP